MGFDPVGERFTISRAPGTRATKSEDRFAGSPPHTDGHGMTARGGGVGVHDMPGIKTLSLVKGKEQFCFRYEPGQEAGVLDALIEMVNRRDMAFDWFDAAVLSHQLGQHLAKELKAYLPKKAA